MLVTIIKLLFSLRSPRMKTLRRIPPVPCSTAMPIRCVFPLSVHSSSSSLSLIPDDHCCWCVCICCQNGELSAYQLQRLLKNNFPHGEWIHITWAQHPACSYISRDSNPFHSQEVATVLDLIPAGAWSLQWMYPWVNKCFTLYMSPIIVMLQSNWKPGQEWHCLSSPVDVMSLTCTTDRQKPEDDLHWILCSLEEDQWIQGNTANVAMMKEYVSSFTC